MPIAKKPKPNAKSQRRFTLLPCPFCGAVPVEDAELMLITCENPKCAVGPSAPERTLTAARRAWNRRAP